MDTSKLDAFLNHGHGLSCSSWSAWFTAFQYADSLGSPLLKEIDKGCDYAGQQKHVPQRYLAAAERLYSEAINAKRG